MMMVKKTDSSSKTEPITVSTDVLTPEQRSRCMSSIKGKDTAPEKLVRSLVFSMGYRYRLHDKMLSGKPDLVFSKHRKVIFVHGCFWHMHSCRYGKVRPKTNEGFWESKRRRNTERDCENERTLLAEGWTPLVIWECEIKDKVTLERKIRDFLQ